MLYELTQIPTIIKDPLEKSHLLNHVQNITIVLKQMYGTLLCTEHSLLRLHSVILVYQLKQQYSKRLHNT